MPVRGLIFTATGLTIFVFAVRAASGARSYEDALRADSQFGGAICVLAAVVAVSYTQAQQKSGFVAPDSLAITVAWKSRQTRFPGGRVYSPLARAFALKHDDGCPECQAPMLQDR